MLVINTSPNKRGNSVRLAEKYLVDKEYHLLHLIDFLIAPYGQTIEGDEFFTVYDQFARADQVIFTDPSIGGIYLVS